jgi:ribosomal-protein-alanine N-acetyltransferase
MALGGIVRGKKVTLRTPTEGDLAFVNGLMADMRVRREGQLWGEPAMPPTWKERLKEAAKDERSVLWTIASDATPVGLAQVGWHFSPGHCDLSHLVIHPEHWGHGLGTDAAIALLRYLFDYLADTRAVATQVAADNVRALRLAATIGFTEYARGHEVYFRDGRYTDQVYLRFDRETWDAKWAATEREYAPLPEGIER